MATAAHAAEYVVAKTGDDANDGSEASPFLTISRAAELAGPGDTVTVRAGTYREWVSPGRGGTSEADRIVYRAAEGEDVRIVGSERLTSWQRDGRFWKVTLLAEFFGPLNPYVETIRHPDPVAADDVHEGWGWLTYGRRAHRGAVLLNGRAYAERFDKARLAEPETWYTETHGGVTTIWANFGDVDPNSENAEISVRPYAFYPRTPGLGYLTVKGFVLMNVANHWAPPTVHQPGAIGPNGGHHWIIEDNIVLNAKAVCISLGLPTGAANQAEAGHHIVRRNIIMRCGQGAIAGQGWNSHSLIAENHIEQINHRREFGGFETAAIKLHNAGDVRIERNFVSEVRTRDKQYSAAHGIWIDYENKDVALSRNLIREVDSFAILLEANWVGRIRVDNNIVLGGGLGLMSSVVDLWAHNLLVDTWGFWQNQDYQDRPAVRDARWLNNLFVRGSLADVSPDPIQRFGPGVYQPPADAGYAYANNVYLDGARAVGQETGSVALAEGTSLRTDEDDQGITLTWTVPTSLSRLTAPAVDAELLGEPFEQGPEGAFTVDHDYFGRAHDTNAVRPGPFSLLEPGLQSIRIYEFPRNHARARALIGRTW
jgi:alpha-N-arabinofuranosidase